MDIKPWHISLIGVILPLVIGTGILDAENTGKHACDTCFLGPIFNIFLSIPFILTTLMLSSRSEKTSRFGAFSNILLGILAIWVLGRLWVEGGILFIISGIWQFGIKGSGNPVSLSDATTETKK